MELWIVTLLHAVEPRKRTRRTHKYVVLAQSREEAIAKLKAKIGVVPGDDYEAYPHGSEVFGAGPGTRSI